MEKEQTQEKYIRQNGEDVVGEKAIAAVRKQQLKDCVRNNRLGNYNRFGRYVMLPGIVNDLLRVTKYIHKDHFKDAIEDSKGGIELKASSYLPVFGELEFRLIIKDKFAKLYIMENVYRELKGYQEIYGEEVVESYCDDDKADIIEYNLALFNMKVVDKNDIDGKKLEDLQEDSEIVENILAQKVFLSIVAKNYLKGSMTDEKEIFEEMVEKLKNEGGEYGKKVLKHFIDRIEKRPDIMQIPEDGGYNEALNDMLVGAMEVATTEDDMLDPNIAKLYDDIYDTRYRKTDKEMADAAQGVTSDLLEDAMNRLGMGMERGRGDGRFRELVDDLVDSGKEEMAINQGGDHRTVDGRPDELSEYRAVLKNLLNADAIAAVAEEMKKVSATLGDVQEILGGETPGAPGQTDLNANVDKIVRSLGDTDGKPAPRGGQVLNRDKQGLNRGPVTKNNTQVQADTGYTSVPPTGKGHGDPQITPGDGQNDTKSQPFDIVYAGLDDDKKGLVDDWLARGYTEAQALANLVGMPNHNARTFTTQDTLTIDSSVQTDGGLSKTGKNTHLPDGLSHNLNNHNPGSGGQGGDGGRGYGD